MNPLLTAFLLASASQGLTDPAEPGQRRIAKEVLDQMLAEDENVYHSRDYRGHDRILIGSRPRASNTGGLCRFDSLSIERAPATPAATAGPGGIREIEVTRWFYVLTGAGEKPLWDLSGDALERRCAQVSSYEGRWFMAQEGHEAKAAVIALSALKAELLKAEPSPEAWSCMKRECPDPRKIGDLIQPLDPGSVSSDPGLLTRCPADRWCLSLQLEDPTCGAWVTQIRMDRKDNDRFRSAYPAWRAGLLHCSEREMSEAGSSPP